MTTMRQAERTWSQFCAMWLVAALGFFVAGLGAALWIYALQWGGFVDMLIRCETGAAGAFIMYFGVALIGAGQKE